MCCKTCKFLDVPPDKIGRIVIRSDSVYKCTAPEPEVPKIPACMTAVYGCKWPPPRRMMRKDDGAGCPTYEKRV